MSSLTSPYFLGAKILVVESDRETRKGIIEGLENFGFVAFGAESNGEALSFIDQEMDVVVFDLSMWKRGGIDLLDEWKRRRPTTKLIGCSRNPDEEYLALRKHGARPCFGPATNMGRLVSAIRRSLEQEEADQNVELPPGYTLELAKALMHQGQAEHEQGKLTVAAEAWDVGYQKWTKQIERWFNRLGTGRP